MQNRIELFLTFTICFPASRKSPSHSPLLLKECALKRGTNVSPFASNAACRCMSAPLDFETVVKRYHRDLYHFAFSLAGNEADASDLMQETFYIWASKGSQLRDPASAKRWLFTTLHREFLQTLRRRNRFREYELDEVCAELPEVSSDVVGRLDGATVLELLSRLEERYRAPLALYYMEDYSYLEISALLEIPLGTVQSRIARGKAQLLGMLTRNAKGTPKEARHD